MKPRVASFALTAGFLGLAVLFTAFPGHAQAEQIPMSASKYIETADLTAEELAFYRGLAPAAAKDFIATRSYVRVCFEVIQYKTPALQLPDRPPGFNVEYLLPTDPNVINRAIIFYLQAKQGVAHPQVLELTAAQMVRPADLDAEELAEYKSLGGQEAQEFIETRSYVRVCRQYLDHKLSKDDLPAKPLGFNDGFLLPEDKPIVEAAITQAAKVALEQAIR